MWWIPPSNNTTHELPLSWRSGTNPQVIETNGEYGPTKTKYKVNQLIVRAGVFMALIQIISLSVYIKNPAMLAAPHVVLHNKNQAM